MDHGALEDSSDFGDVEGRETKKTFVEGLLGDVFDVDGAHGRRGLRVLMVVVLPGHLVLGPHAGVPGVDSWGARPLEVHADNAHVGGCHDCWCLATARGKQRPSCQACSHTRREATATVTAAVTLM